MQVYCNEFEKDGELVVATSRISIIRVNKGSLFYTSTYKNAKTEFRIVDPKLRLSSICEHSYGML